MDLALIVSVQVLYAVATLVIISAGLARDFRHDARDQSRAW
jgi:hypothetical protein